MLNFISSKSFLQFMIIGITGYLGAGKDTVADYFKKMGYEHISLSDILREDLRNAKKKVTRENLQELGAQLRQLSGDGLLAQRALSLLDPRKNYIISSIGTVGEIKTLKKNQHFVLVFVDAPQKTRFERIAARKREEDPTTFADFQKHEAKENKKGTKKYREFDLTRKHADVIINNNGSIQDVHAKVDKFLLDLNNKPAFKRPSWDDYFVGIMDSVAKRATCNRGKNGCVIVKDKRILCTGYVGSPVGLEHCDDAGHLMHKVYNADGSTSNHCVRTIHAEQNAITQAAKYGIPIGGATIYTKLEPCRVCAMLIINAGIKRVVAVKRYHRAQDTRVMFKKAGVHMDVMEDTVEKYSNQ